MQHDIKAYKDGHKLVSYCHLCGLEADEIVNPLCGGKPIIKLNGKRTSIEKIVDTGTELILNLVIATSQ